MGDKSKKDKDKSNKQKQAKQNNKAKKEGQRNAYRHHHEIISR